MTPEFETLGYYTAPDFVVLGRAYGLDERAVLDLIRLFRRKSDAVEEMVGQSLLSSGAQAEYLRIYRDRLNMFRDVKTPFDTPDCAFGW